MSKNTHTDPAVSDAEVASAMSVVNSTHRDKQIQVAARAILMRDRIDAYPKSKHEPIPKALTQAEVARLKYKEGWAAEEAKTAAASAVVDLQAKAKEEKGEPFRFIDSPKTVTEKLGDSVVAKHITVDYIETEATILDITVRLPAPATYEAPQQEVLVGAS